jgi:signal peptidase II
LKGLAKLGKILFGLLCVGLIFAVLQLDYVTKSLIFKTLRLHESVPVINGILNLTLVKNTGAAFGIMKNSQTFFVVFSVAAIFLILLLLLFYKAKNPIFKFGLSMLVGGAIGNLYDRVTLGFVIDFIDLAFINFPIFNFADFFITVGAAFVLVYFAIFEWKNDGKNVSENDKIK